MELRRYLLKKGQELKEIERDLAKCLGVSFVRCSYDCVNSHNHQDKDEIKYRKAQVKESDNVNDTYILDYVINYEVYDTKENYDKNNGGSDGEVHELRYLVGNGKYIVIVGN